jgi:hypothetical protein
MVLAFRVEAFWHSLPRQILTQDDGLVQMARRSASSGNITVQKLRGNISVLMGAGGNIAVLPGPGGKLLIDAGFAGSRPKITEALASISSDPIKQLYWEYFGKGYFNAKGVSIPVAVSVFPDELYPAPQSWTDQAYPNLIHYNRLPKGGHFAAWEQPKLFTEELRAGFRSLRPLAVKSAA